MPPLPDVISALRRAARPPAPAAGPEAGDPDAALTAGPDGEDLTAAEDPYTDLYEALPAPDSDGGSAAPGNRPGSVPRPEAEPPPGASCRPARSRPASAATTGPPSTSTSPPSAASA